MRGCSSTRYRSVFPADCDHLAMITRRIIACHRSLARRSASRLQGITVVFVCQRGLPSDRSSIASGDGMRLHTWSCTRDTPAPSYPTRMCAKVGPNHPCGALHLNSQYVLYDNQRRERRGETVSPISVRSSVLQTLTQHCRLLIDRPHHKTYLHPQAYNRTVHGQSRWVAAGGLQDKATSLSPRSYRHSRAEYRARHVWEVRLSV